MNFVINVAHKVGNHVTHVFATAPHSLTDRRTAESLFALLKTKFPETEGYKVALYQQLTTLTEV